MCTRWCETENTYLLMGEPMKYGQLVFADITKAHELVFQLLYYYQP
jgi:hypothetical protein